MLFKILIFIYSKLIFFSFKTRAPPPPQKKKVYYAAYGIVEPRQYWKEFHDRDPFVVVVSTPIFPYTANNVRVMYPKKDLAKPCSQISTKYLQNRGLQYFVWKFDIE
jgi:hypothetical protein